MHLSQNHFYRRNRRNRKERRSINDQHTALLKWKALHNFSSVCFIFLERDDDYRHAVET